MTRLDHIAVAVRDVEQAASSILQLHGLQAYAGGRTAGHSNSWHDFHLARLYFSIANDGIAGLGVQNYIIPIGDGYIELIGISDEREASANPLGR